LGDWWNDGLEGIDEGLALYAEYTSARVEEPFEEAARIVQARTPPYLDHSNLEAVIRFKVGDNRWLGPTLAAIQQTVDVESITRRALADATAGKDRTAILGLIAPHLPRFGVPIGSAILALAMPDRFGIIDRFAMGEVANIVTTAVAHVNPPDAALALLSRALIPWVEDNDKLSAYEPFTAGLRQRAHDLGTRTPRDIEKALFAFTLHRRSRARI
jgi:hypothetical protein